FESGHRSLQGSVAGSFFTPTAGRWRGEFSAAAGASRYVDFASFWHTIAEARLHVVETERGAWISGAAGRASYGSAPRSVVALGERTAIVLSGGRYPTDPISGSIAAHYLTAAIRIHTAAWRHVVARGRTAPRAGGADGAGAPGSGARLEVQLDRSRPVRLLVHVAEATRVEVAGDFTDRRPPALSPAGGGLWEVV